MLVIFSKRVYDIGKTLQKGELLKMKKVLIAVMAVVLVVGCVFAFTACGKNVYTLNGVEVKTGTLKDSLTDVTTTGIKAYGTLVIATNPEFPPFESMEGKNAVGWDIDVAAAFAKELGVNVLVNTMDFDSVLGAPNANKCHISMAGITANAERAKTLDFTQTIFNSSHVIIVKESNTNITGPFDLAGKKVGAQRGTVGHLLANLDEDWAYDGEDPILGQPASVHPYDSGAMAVSALVNGDIDAVIIDQYPAEQFVNANAGNVKIVKDAEGNYNSVFDDEYAFAVKKGNTELLNYLNNLIDTFKTNGTMAAINNKYFG